MNKRYLLIFLMIFLISPMIVNASLTYWRDDFSTDNFQTTGDLSEDYWLIVSDNTNVTKTVSDGILNLTHSRSTASVEQTWIAKRLVSAETTIFSQIKWKLPTSPSASFSANAGVMKNSTHWVWELQIDASAIKLGIVNTTGSFEWKTIISNPTIDTWYSYKVTVGTNTVSITNGTSTLEYNCYFSYNDCAEYILKTTLIEGSSASGTVLIDYIYWGSINQTITPWIPVIVTFTMLGFVLGFIKKIGT